MLGAAVPLSSTERPPVADGPAAGALIAFVHGSMDRASSFRRVMQHLPDARVLTYDRRGYAHSRNAGDPPRTLAGQAADLLELLDGRPPVVVGHSFGGDVAMAAAVEAGRQILAVVAYEPPMPWMSWWPSQSASTVARNAFSTGGPEAAAEMFMRRLVGDAVWDRLPEHTQAARRAEGEALMADMACLHGKTTERLDPARVTVPTVVARGSNSRPHHRRNTEQLPAVMPRAELVEVEGAAHSCHTSHPAAFADLVRLALRRCAVNW